MQAITTLIASVRHAARTQETVTIGGGIFTPEELKAAALAHADMVNAFHIIASQSIGPDWTKEQAFDFMRKYARETIGLLNGNLKERSL